MGGFMDKFAPKFKKIHKKSTKNFKFTYLFFGGNGVKSKSI
jgi:hypothetical protein